MAEKNNSNARKARDQDNTQDSGNEIRVGRRRAEAYVRDAEDKFREQDTLILCGLGNTIKTVVSCAEICKYRKYATITKIETSLIEDNNRSSIAKVQITLKRNEGVKELLDRIAKEREAENL
jgi:DNA-binding protein